jgi:hypothetical protein
MAPVDEARRLKQQGEWLKEQRLRERCSVLPHDALTEYPVDTGRVVIFADRRLGVSQDPMKTLAVTDVKALAAHEFWHRRTEQSWADYRWRSDLREGLSGELLEIRPLKASGPQPRVGAEVVLRFWRVEHPRFEVTVNGKNVAGKLRADVIDVLFEVQEQSSTQFYVRVVKEQPPIGEKQEWECLLAGKAQAVGVVKLMDVLYGSSGVAARKSAQELMASRAQGPLILRHLQ